MIIKQVTSGVNNYFSELLAGGTGQSLRMGSYTRLLLECMDREELKKEGLERAVPLLVPGIRMALNPKSDNDRLIRFIKETEDCTEEEILTARLIFDINEDRFERWDGRGRPYGKSGKSIALTARALSVAGVYERVTGAAPADRNRHAAACICIGREGGRKLDPDLVRTFLDHNSDFLQLQNRMTAGRGCPQ